MNKEEFMELLGQAYGFPDYYAHNLDSAEEIIDEIKERQEKERLSLEPFFSELLSEVSAAERAKIWGFLTDHFAVIQTGSAG